jgi:hypothetical protein
LDLQDLERPNVPRISRRAADMTDETGIDLPKREPRLNKTLDSPVGCMRLLGGLIGFVA